MSRFTLPTLTLLGALGFGPSVALAAPPELRHAQDSLDRAANLAKRGSNCRRFITEQARALADDLTEQSVRRSLERLDQLQDTAGALCPPNVRVTLRHARNWLISYQVNRGWTPLWTWNTVETAQRACDRGYPEACFVLGERHEQGRQVKKDLALAATLYGKACESQWAKACTALGLLHREGKGVEKNLETSAKLFLDGCEGKDSKGCHYYGLQQEAGEGVMANPIDAKKYFQRACKGGYKPACAKTKDPARIGTPPGGEKYEEEISL